MNNLERLELAIPDIKLSVATKEVYLQEQNLKPVNATLKLGQMLGKK